jgi:riboflavin kinase/FMN adenylyltransferase
MQIIHDLDELREPAGASVLTIGNFDGVHLAHQELFRKVAAAARAEHATATAVTFDPHPAKILAPERAPWQLSSLRQKTELIEKLGIERLIVLPFTEELSRLSPRDFVREILFKRLRPRAIFVGPNFRFGHRQTGDVRLLAELGREEGFSVETLPMIEVRGERVSSSRIRELLAQGEVSIAGRMLGRPYASIGAIVAGRGIGKKQTVPTLNLAPVEEQLPRVGVYVTWTRLGDQLHESVTNVGFRPTFGQDRLTVESFLLNFEDVIHQAEMEIRYLHRLRDEMKFPDAAALKSQIQKDARRALRFFHLLKLVRPHPSEVTTARQNTA